MTDKKVAFATYKFHLQGLGSLLMHNERLANPLSKETQRLKALTSKRKKTDEDHWAISRAEFDGGLYLNGQGPFIPDHWVSGMLRDAAKANRLGKAITQGVLFLQTEFPILLDRKALGLKTDAAPTADDLWAAGFYDQRMVGNQKARVLRTRPKFESWAIEGEFQYDTSVFDERTLTQILEYAGVKIGLGDYRPRFGRFEMV